MPRLTRRDAFRKKMIELEKKLLDYYTDRRHFETPVDGSFCMSAWLSGYRAAVRDMKGEK